MSDARLEPGAGDEPSAALVRAELARVLASELFTRSERLSAFLTFIVERTLAGEGDSLKEHVLAIALYGKGADFNTAADPIVRVDARRLRDRLREYYAGVPAGGIVISVPRGAYTPVFHVVAPPAGSQGASSHRQPGSQATVGHPGSKGQIPKRWWMAAAAVVLLGAIGLGVMRLARGDRLEPPRLLTTTSMPGAEENPALSSDGNFVAFSWGGSAPTDSPDIWIKAVDGDAARRLTDTPGVMEKYPRWSPDGQFVAFTRYVKGRPSILRMSALGGREEMIAEGIGDADWSPDGKSIVGVARTAEGRSALARHVLETGARQQLTEAPEGFGELHPAVSPDGRTVAFSRSGERRSAVFLVPISGGKVEPLGEWTSGVIGGIEWTPDGRELLVARPAPSGRRLMRIAVDKPGTEVAVAGIPYESIAPSVSGVRRGGSFRLAVVSGHQDVGLRLVDLQAPQNEGRITGDTQFCDASRLDSPGRFSPDGREVAFTSAGSGSQQVWVASLDGTAPRMVTQFQDASVSLGSWSPDGRWLAVDATIGNRTHVYIVPVNGGPVRRLTKGRWSVKSSRVLPGVRRRNWRRSTRRISSASSSLTKWATLWASVTHPKGS
jgi:Tol biopolymer transport system component